MKQFFNRAFAAMEYVLALPRFNIVKTIWFNFRTIPFPVAIRLPVHIYGRVRLCSLAGSVEFMNTPVRGGLVTFGKNHSPFWSPSTVGALYLCPGSKMVFEGSCKIGKGYSVNLANGSRLQLGGNVAIGERSRIVCGKCISIGEFTRIAYDVQFMDTNFHYTLNVTDGGVRRHTGAISIGRYNWISNGVYFLMGAKTPDYTILAARSLLNKDISAEGENIMAAGTPAKVVARNVRRVFSFKAERDIYDWFNDNPDADIHYPTLSLYDTIPSEEMSPIRKTFAQKVKWLLKKQD